MVIGFIVSKGTGIELLIQLIGQVEAARFRGIDARFVHLHLMDSGFPPLQFFDERGIVNLIGEVLTDSREQGDIVIPKVIELLPPIELG